MAGASYLADKGGNFGTTILTDCKNGSDKPNDNTLRLTLMRSPDMQPANNGRPRAYTDQANQDWGHHEFVFGLTGHAGDWRGAQTDWQAYRLNDPQWCADHIVYCVPAPHLCAAS